MVTWDDANAFCKWLSKADGKEYRLPTEAEWEFACRGGTLTAFYFGDDPEKLEDYAWYNKNSGNTTHAVAQKKPNARGLYDMHGNAFQWCSDKWGQYPKGPVTDPEGATDGTFRVNLGGGMFNVPKLCRSAYRSNNPQGQRTFELGFRIASTRKE